MDFHLFMHVCMHVCSFLCTADAYPHTPHTPSAWKEPIQRIQSNPNWNWRHQKLQKKNCSKIAPSTDPQLDRFKQGAAQLFRFRSPAATFRRQIHTTINTQLARKGRGRKYIFLSRRRLIFKILAVYIQYIHIQNLIVRSISKLTPKLQIWLLGRVASYRCCYCCCCRSLRWRKNWIWMPCGEARMLTAAAWIAVHCLPSSGFAAMRRCLYADGMGSCTGAGLG